MGGSFCLLWPLLSSIPYDLKRDPATERDQPTRYPATSGERRDAKRPASSVIRSTVPSFSINIQKIKRKLLAR